MRFSLFMLLRICSSLTLFAVLSSSSALAGRVRKDLPSSSNGSNPGKAAVCADNATPFAAALNGKVTNTNTCSVFTAQTYPDRRVVLTPSDNSFTLTVTPILWENTGASTDSRRTILHLEFSSTNPNLSLKSFVVAGITATNANVSPAWVACDFDQFSDGLIYALPVVGDNQPGDTATTITACMEPTMSLQGAVFGTPGKTNVIQPPPVQFADTNTTRWDVVGVSGSNPLASPLPSVDLLVSGFPSDLNPDIDPNNPPSTTPPTNNLTQSFMAAKSNFLAVAFNSQTNATVTAGSLSITPVSKALTNDSIANATVVDPAAAEGAGFS